MTGKASGELFAVDNDDVVVSTAPEALLCDCPPGGEDYEEWVDEELIESILAEIPDDVITRVTNSPGMGYIGLIVTTLGCDEDGTMEVDEFTVFAVASDEEISALANAIANGFQPADTDREEG